MHFYERPAKQNSVDFLPVPFYALELHATHFLIQYCPVKHFNNTFQLDH
uniref:Uncharacterized protein n=1 Tax=Anguilla anguilla TaxID=7936 RepID=A0A0E9V0V8_ANGAN